MKQEKGEKLLHTRRSIHGSVRTSIDDLETNQKHEKRRE